MSRQTKYLEELSIQQNKSKAQVLVDTLNATDTQVEAAEKLKVSRQFISNKLSEWGIETRYCLNKTKDALTKQS